MPSTAASYRRAISRQAAAQVGQAITRAIVGLSTDRKLRKALYRAISQEAARIIFNTTLPARSPDPDASSSSLEDLILGLGKYPDGLSIGELAGLVNTSESTVRVYVYQLPQFFARTRYPYQIDPLRPKARTKVSLTPAGQIVLARLLLPTLAQPDQDSL